jgi:hypothetical protein
MYTVLPAQFTQRPFDLFGRKGDLPAYFHGRGPVIDAYDGQVHVKFKKILERTQNSAWRIQYIQAVLNPEVSIRHRQPPAGIVVHQAGYPVTWPGRPDKPLAPGRSR